MIKYLKLLAAGSGMLFLCYCYYFDKKRRTDPDFKRKLHERRNRNRTAISAPTDLGDKELEMYFLDQMRRGQGLIMNGDVEGGADHLINALIVCNQPGTLLQLLQNTLPMEIFTVLLIKMHAYETSQKRETVTPVIVNEEGIGALE